MRAEGAYKIITDWADGGNLKDYLALKRWTSKTIGGEFGEVSWTPAPLSEDEILTWLTQIAIGLEECHTQEIVHRNLASEHIYLLHKDYYTEKPEE